MAAPVSHRPCAHAGTESGRSPNPLFAEEQRTKAFLREEGGPRSGGRSTRDFQFARILLLRALPQSPTAPAPSRREPLCKPVSTKNTTKEKSLVVFVFSPLRMQREVCSSMNLLYVTSLSESTEVTLQKSLECSAVSCFVACFSWASRWESLVKALRCMIL